MNLEPTTSSVEVEHCGHVHHSSVVDVELSHSQHPRQFDPLDELRRRNVTERDGDAYSELDVWFGAYWTLDGQVDGGRGAAVGNDRHVRRNQIGARQRTRQQILYVGDSADRVAERSSGYRDYNRRYVRGVASAIPDVAVVRPVGQMGHTEDTYPRRHADSRSVIVERRVQHQFVVARVLDLPLTVSPHRVRQRAPHGTTFARATHQISLVSRAAQREVTVRQVETTTDGRIVPPSLSSRFHGNGVVVNAGKQRDVKYPTEADAADYSECHQRANE